MRQMHAVCEEKQAEHLTMLAETAEVNSMSDRVLRKRTKSRAPYRKRLKGGRGGPELSTIVTPALSRTATAAPADPLSFGDAQARTASPRTHAGPPRETAALTRMICRFTETPWGRARP